MDDTLSKTSTTAGDTVPLFDHLAAEYDSWYQTPLGALAHALEQEAVFALAGEVRGRTTLDASCGTGHYALAMARRGARVAAVDVSGPMLALAQTKAQREGLPLMLVCASLEHLPFRADSFELVTCILALEFVADPAAAVAEVARVQTPGGRLLIGALGRFSFWALWRRLKGLFRRSLWRSAHFFSRTELVQLMRAAGYGALSERGAIYFPPVDSARLLTVLRRLERLGHRWAPGTAASLTAVGGRDGDSRTRVE
jgi:ubiquinone/menaquinone biosynthesis C-methylase UbiE